MAKKIIYGYHAIEETIKAQNIQGSLLIARESLLVKKQGRLERLMKLAREKHVNIVYSSTKDLNIYTDKENHRGCLLIVENYSPAPQAIVELKSFLASFTKDKALIIILDQVTDPHNYGAILRSADMFAVDLLIIPERRSVKETEAVRTTSAGAHVYVPVAEVTNLNQAIEQLKNAGFWIYGAEMAGKSAHTIELKGKVAIVMGSEGRGIRQLILDNCDDLIAIPTSGHIDSLNVSVAAGIIMYEVRRQQSFYD